MVAITLPPELEQVIIMRAKQQGTTPEQFALQTLRSTLLPAVSLETTFLEPQDEWEVLLRSVASPAGVSLSDEAVSRETMYD